MAKKTKSAGGSEFAAEERRSYVEAVIRKQAGLSPADAANRADELTEEEREAVHDAGREGRVADCRALLGLA